MAVNAERLVGDGASTKEGGPVTTTDYRSDVARLRDAGYEQRAAEAHARRWHGMPESPPSGAEMAPTGPIAHMPDYDPAAASGQVPSVPFKAPSLADAAQTAIAEAAAGTGKPKTNGKGSAIPATGQVGAPTPGSPYQLQLDRFAVDPEAVDNAVRAWAKPRGITIRRMASLKVLQEFTDSLVDWAALHDVTIRGRIKAKDIKAYLAYLGYQHAKADSPEA